MNPTFSIYNVIIKKNPFLHSGSFVFELDPVLFFHKSFTTSVLTDEYVGVLYIHIVVVDYH